MLAICSLEGGRSRETPWSPAGVSRHVSDSTVGPAWWLGVFALIASRIRPA
jgi:hypothetical protein